MQVMDQNTNTVTVDPRTRETIMRRIHLSDSALYRRVGETYRARIAAGKAAACTRRLKDLDAIAK